jgi:hypothetical protein
MTRTWQVEVRVEVFNALNRDNFIRLNNIYGDGPTPPPTFLAPWPASPIRIRRVRFSSV